MAWHIYQENIRIWNIFLKRNTQLAYINYDEFLEELELRRWDKKLTRLPDKNIHVALLREFYYNIYDLEDDSRKQCKVRGKVIKFRT